MEPIYVATNAPVYLDVGNALAAFGLIFAVYQLRRPQWDLVLKIRDSWQRNLFWILGTVGLLLTCRVPLEIWTGIMVEGG